MLKNRPTIVKTGELFRKWNSSHLEVVVEHEQYSQVCIFLIVSPLTLSNEILTQEH